MRINNALLDPQSILVVGASDHIQKPGGNLIHNLLTGDYRGSIYGVNPKGGQIQGITCFATVEQAPSVDLAIIAIASDYCLHAVKVLAQDKGVKAFIIISAGFSEATMEGAALEAEIISIIDSVGGVMIGPNCIGLANSNHCSVFTSPVPTLHSKGVDLISGSGGVALFVIETALTMGLQFNSIWTLGNSKMVGVEDAVEYMDLNYNSELSSSIKLLYIETIKDPDRFLYHCSSLIRKGCKIAAIKSGSSESGMRAASSHTGALASPDSAVEALFRKAGIVRCYSREELATVGALFTLKQIKGRSIGIVTHAGGPAVILTDALSKGGLQVPVYKGEYASELQSHLLAGSAVSNPIDILGTGDASHLALAIDYCENHFDEVDAIAVIFGSTGLGKIDAAIEVIGEKIKSCHKPIIPILPSVINTKDELQIFMSQGYVNFSDEALLASSLAKICNTPQPASRDIELMGVDIPLIRSIIDAIPTNGYIDQQTVSRILRAAGVATVPYFETNELEALLGKAREMGYPLVAKVVGPVHKSDIAGVVLNIKTDSQLSYEFDRMMLLPEVTAVMIQPMIKKGKELFVGGKYEQNFGHVVLCGLGGIFVEILGDISSGLAPLNYQEAHSMIQSLRGYKIIKGIRGDKGIDQQAFAEIIVRISTLLRFATEIKEMDINPLLATDHGIIAVDARIRIEK